MDASHIKELFAKTRPKAFCSLRLVGRIDHLLSVRTGIVEPPRSSSDFGVMVTVYGDHGGYGYGATGDVSEAGLKKAFASAEAWAKVSARFPLPSDLPIRDLKGIEGQFKAIGAKSWGTQSLVEKIERLECAAARLSQGPFIVDYEAQLFSSHMTQIILNSAGTEIVQEFEFLTPTLSTTAFKDGSSETRSFVGGAYSRQGGLEILDTIKFEDIATVLPGEARTLLAAPQCPSGTMDLILAPDQMILQIHESIGHPLELDRILGDERNFAGTSFVTQDMFGSYVYGSEHLNISFAPDHAGEIASYGFDDEGTPAETCFLIEKGILKRGLGGLSSQRRSKLPGVASARAASWNRPPIDRMANLNLAPGNDTINELISKVERGIFMKTNSSWSIDDSRNKFQFGCEWGQLIENGRLTQVVRKPNYRGISSSFWRSLAALGNADSMETLGALNCGKGEPNQIIAVGHATPAALFRSVAVFGGES